MLPERRQQLALSRHQAQPIRGYASGLSSYYKKAPCPVLKSRMPTHTPWGIDTPCGVLRLIHLDSHVLVSWWCAGGVRVPALLHSPLLPSSRRGVSVPHLFSIMDWAPTFLHLAGLKVQSQEAHGCSILVRNTGSKEGQHIQTHALSVMGRRIQSTPLDPSLEAPLSLVPRVVPVWCCVRRRQIWMG